MTPAPAGPVDDAGGGGGRSCERISKPQPVALCCIVHCICSSGVRKAVNQLDTELGISVSWLPLHEGFIVHAACRRAGFEPLPRDDARCIVEGAGGRSLGLSDVGI